ncbi:hypothetical protein D5086_031666 [Populus alba]|uniref:Uncharacterized protein n=1 Tax=Populus alba TaxID=43335 RepID=A0ACC4AJ84_POPAL
MAMAIRHQKYIGKVKHAVFQTQKTGRKRVLVSTEENVIASLDLRHGEIFWRHVLGTNDAIDGIDIAMGKYVVGIFSSGTKATQNHSCSLRQARKLTRTTQSLFLVKEVSMLFQACMVKLFGRWIFLLKVFEVQEVIQHHDSNTVYVVGFVGFSQFDVYQINAKNGELIKHDSAAFDGGFSGERTDKHSHWFSMETMTFTSNVKQGHDWNSDLLKERIKLNQQRGFVHKVFMNNYVRTDKSHGFRALIVMEDHSLLLLQQEKKGVTVAKVEQNLFEWLKGHMLKVKGTLMLASAEDVAAIQDMSHATPPFTDSTEQRLASTNRYKWTGNICTQEHLRLLPFFKLEFFKHLSGTPVEAIMVLLKGHGLKEGGNCDGEVADNYCFWYQRSSNRKLSEKLNRISWSANTDNKDVLGSLFLESTISLHLCLHIHDQRSQTKSQSYYFTHSGQSGITVTKSTAKGITSKPSSYSGQLVIRSVNPTQSEKRKKEFYLLQISLPIIPHPDVTHSPIKVEGLRGMSNSACQAGVPTQPLSLT